MSSKNCSFDTFDWPYWRSLLMNFSQMQQGISAFKTILWLLFSSRNKHDPFQCLLANFNFGILCSAWPWSSTHLPLKLLHYAFGIGARTPLLNIQTTLEGCTQNKLLIFVNFDQNQCDWEKNSGLFCKTTRGHCA